jgi:hypothetical protein
MERIVFDSTNDSLLRQNALSSGYCAVNYAWALRVQAVRSKPIQPFTIRWSAAIAKEGHRAVAIIQHHFQAHGRKKLVADIRQIG